MQRVKVIIEVEYRSDGTAGKGIVFDAICSLLLSVDRAEIFKNDATFAGYRVSFPPKAPNG